MAASNMIINANAMIIDIILIVIVRHPFDVRILHFTTEINHLVFKVTCS